MSTCYFLCGESVEWAIADTPEGTEVMSLQNGDMNGRTKCSSRNKKAESASSDYLSVLLFYYQGNKCKLLLVNRSLQTCWASAIFMSSNPYDRHPLLF